MFDFLIGLGVIGVIILIVILILLPFIATIIVGAAIANILGFTGVVWWCFMIIFYLVTTAIIGSATK